MEKPMRRPVAGPSQEPGSWSARGSDQDFYDWAAWLDREAAAGRDPIPPEPAVTRGISVSLGGGDGIDPGLLAAICGTDDDGLGPQFAQDAAADVLPPGPLPTCCRRARCSRR